jgi:hypothetical protein
VPSATQTAWMNSGADVTATELLNRPALMSRTGLV